METKTRRSDPADFLFHIEDSLVGRRADAPVENMLPLGRIMV